MEILEVLGTHSDEEEPDLEIRIWECTEGERIEEDTIVKLSISTPSCGMGCNKREKWENVFRNKWVDRAILSNDCYEYDITTRKVKSMLKQNAPTTIVKLKSIWSLLQSKGRIIKNGVIYTDGSWKDQREMKDILFRKSYNLSDASSAVVIIDKEDDWKQKEAITIRITANTSNMKEQLTKAFTMEAIAILAATQILKWYNHEAEITTDCRGVLNKLNYGYVESWANHGQAQILRAIHTNYKKKLNWTRSHPEKRKKVGQYTKDDFGIAMADAVCEQDLRNEDGRNEVKEMMGEIKFLNIHHYEISLEDVLKEILKASDYAWTRENVPIVTTLQSMRESDRKREYLMKRDLWNKDSNGEVRNVWECSSIEHAGAISKAKGIKNKAIATRIQYDWEEHGRNRAKKVTDTYEAEITEQCRECGLPDSQYHIISQCITKRLTNIRVDTDARIDVYIRNIEEKGECTDFHNTLKNMVTNSIRSEKLRLGMWEQRDINEFAQLVVKENTAERDIMIMRREMENMNSIYYLGCRKLIREKKMMDWEERNPNKKKKKKKDNNYRKIYGSKKKKKEGKRVEINLNKILKDKGNEDIEADLIRNSNRSGIKRKNGKNIYKRRVKSNISSGGLEDKGLNI